MRINMPLERNVTASRTTRVVLVLVSLSRSSIETEVYSSQFVIIYDRSTHIVLQGV